MTTAILALSRAQKNVQSKIDSIELPIVNWKAVCFIGFLISLALLGFYVWQINALTRGYYLINGFEKQLDTLSEENKNLQVSFAENSFLGQALVKIQALNFQKTTTVKYIQVPNTALARAK